MLLYGMQCNAQRQVLDMLRVEFILRFMFMMDLKWKSIPYLYLSKYQRWWRAPKISEVPDPSMIFNYCKVAAGNDVKVNKSLF